MLNATFIHDVHQTNVPLSCVTCLRLPPLVTRSSTRQNLSILLTKNKERSLEMSNLATQSNPRISQRMGNMINPCLKPYTTRFSSESGFLPSYLSYLVSELRKVSAFFNISLNDRYAENNHSSLKQDHSHLAHRVLYLFSSLGHRTNSCYSCGFSQTSRHWIWYRSCFCPFRHARQVLLVIYLHNFHLLYNTCSSESASVVGRIYMYHYSLSLNKNFKMSNHFMLSMSVRVLVIPLGILTVISFSIDDDWLIRPHRGELELKVMTQIANSSCILN